MRLLQTARRENQRAGSSCVVAEVEVRTESGRLVATGSGTFAVISLKTPIEAS